MLIFYKGNRKNGKKVSRWIRPKEIKFEDIVAKDMQVLKIFFFSFSFFGVGGKEKLIPSEKKGINSRKESTYSENSIKILITGYKRESLKEDIYQIGK